MDDPDVKGLVEYLRVVLDTTDSLEQEKEGAIRNFRACWDRAGVSLADLEMRLVSRRAEGLSASMISTLLARSLESASLEPETAATYGQLIVNFLEKKPRTAWLTKMWPKVGAIVRRCNDHREDEEGNLWDTDELTYAMTVFAWKHRKPESECGLSGRGTESRDDSGFSSSNNDGWCSGYDKMTEDMAWKMARCNQMEPDAAKRTAKYYVTGLLSAGINYRKLIKIYHSENEENFKDAMWNALGASSLKDTTAKMRLISLLRWFLAHARKEAMPSGWSAFATQNTSN